jgi:hypothetical protein
MSTESKSSLELQSELIRQLQAERRKLTPEELEIERERIKKLMAEDPINQGCKLKPSVPNYEVLNEPFDI